MAIWKTITEGISAVAGIVKLAGWFTKKRDRADAEEAGAAKQKAADAKETTNAIADGAKADAAMRDPKSKRAKRVRKQFQRD